MHADLCNTVVMQLVAYFYGQTSISHCIKESGARSTQPAKTHQLRGNAGNGFVLLAEPLASLPSVAFSHVRAVVAPFLRGAMCGEISEYETV